MGVRTRGGGVYALFLQQSSAPQSQAKADTKSTSGEMGQGLCLAWFARLALLHQLWRPTDRNRSLRPLIMMIRKLITHLHLRHDVILLVEVPTARDMFFQCMIFCAAPTMFKNDIMAFFSASNTVNLIITSQPKCGSDIAHQINIGYAIFATCELFPLCKHKK